MDTIKSMMQAMKAEKEKAEDRSDQFLQKLGEQKVVFERVCLLKSISSSFMQYGSGTSGRRRQGTELGGGLASSRVSNSLRQRDSLPWARRERPGKTAYSSNRRVQEAATPASFAVSVSEIATRE